MNVNFIEANDRSSESLIFMALNKDTRQVMFIAAPYSSTGNDHSENELSLFALATRGVDTTPYAGAIELGRVDPVDNSCQYYIECNYKFLTDAIDYGLQTIQLYKDGVKLCDRKCSYLNMALHYHYRRLLYNTLRLDGIDLFNNRDKVPIEAVDNASQLMWQWYTANHETINDFTYRFINQC